MSLDDRLEALTQTVELMATMQRDNERRFQSQFEQHCEILAKWAPRVARYSFQSGRLLQPR